MQQLTYYPILSVNGLTGKLLTLAVVQLRSVRCWFSSFAKIINY